MSNEKLVEKYRNLASTVMEKERMELIEKNVLSLEKLEDVGDLVKLLAQPVGESLK